MQLNPVVIPALEFANRTHFADKYPRIVETADLVGCFKSLYVFAAGCRRCVISNVAIFIQPNGYVVSRDSGKRHALRSHSAKCREEDFVLVLREAKVCVQLPACTVFAGEEDHLAFAGLERHIRQSPFIEILRVVREEVAKQRDRFAGEILEFNPLRTIAVRVNRGERVVFERFVDVHGIAWAHHIHRKRRKRDVAVCGFKSWIRGIYSSAGRILDHRYPADDARFPTHAVDQVAL